MSEMFDLNSEPLFPLLLVLFAKFGNGLAEELKREEAFQVGCVCEVALQQGNLPSMLP